MRRCFISVDLNEDTKKEIKKIQDKLPEFRGKKTETENLHLTLKFLGEISDEKIEETRKRLREIKFEKFKIRINKIGVFSEKFVRIIWLGVDEEDEESRRLWDLQREIDDKLGELFERERRFMGHITIARVKNIKDKRKFLDDMEKINLGVGWVMEVDKIKLKESILKPEGPEYKVIEEIS